MFYPNSRYAKSGIYTVTLNGKSVAVARLPLPSPSPLLGYHQRLEGQRLDLIASHYLKDATAFWRLCDANGAMVPDALAARATIGIPAQGR